MDLAVYAGIMPLFSILANTILGWYAIYKNPTKYIVVVFTFFTSALIIWSLGHFMTFNAASAEAAFVWDRLSNLGSILTPVFLLHFILIFSKSSFLSKKYHLLLLYIPTIILGYLAVFTNLLTTSIIPVWWGYMGKDGVLLLPVGLYNIIYVSAGLFCCYQIYQGFFPQSYKIQARNIGIAVSFPFVLGIITQLIFPLFGIEFIPLTTLATTFTAFILFYTINQKELMNPMSFSIHRKLLAGVVFTAIIFLIIGNIGYYFINSSLIIVIILVSILLAYLIFYLISNSLSKPIILLRDKMNDIRQGQFNNTTIPYQSNDEIGDLIASFSKMSSDLQKSQKIQQEYNRNLEQTVADRTAKLKKSIQKLESNRLSLLNIAEDMKETLIEKERTEMQLKQAHSELKALNKDLEKKVDDRTKRIKDLLKQKDDFINQLGHDLKNPLGPMVNLIPILEKHEDDSKKKEMLSVIHRNAQYMRNLVKNTLELASLNSPNSTLNFQQINLKNELQEVIENNAFLFDEHHISISNNLVDDLIIDADKFRLQELLTNLINNAVKYTPEHGTIEINAQEDDRSFTVSLKDSGIGMTKDQLDHIFDEFYKADTSRHDFDSSGLGMTICKRIIEKHGGRIWVESPGMGKGSTFYFSIPKKTT